ncbi:MAG: hypothetical protein C4530_11320 [Desulfobacteraceae bacterium]|nr:MAG: hypothetical protein C4530_11320 [Desulfobacteraceae bacterium]
MLNYLKATGLKACVLINFGSYGKFWREEQRVGENHDAGLCSFFY